MAQFNYRRALLKRGSEVVAKGILVQKEENSQVFWYSDDASWPAGGGSLMGFPPANGRVYHWSMGTASTIAELVNDWNNGRRHDGAICAENACCSLVTEDSDHVWPEDWADLSHVTFDGVVWCTPRIDTEGGIYSEKYTMGNIYTGRQSYHAHHGQTPNVPVEEFKGHRIGVELEVECKDEVKFRKACALKSNWFYQERDGSLGSYGDEFITIPLLPKDAKDVAFWEKLTSPLSKLADSWKKTTCGLHVHIGREILGKDAEQRSETLGKLLYFYHHVIGDSPTAKQVNERVYGRQHTYSEQSGKSKVGEAVGILGKAVLKDKEVCKKLKDGMTAANSSGRYYDINLENTATIEFRKGKGSISAERITAIIAWSEGMVDYCRKTAWQNLDFEEFLEWIRNRRGTPVSLKGFLSVDA